MLSCINVVGGVEAKDKSAILNKKRKKKKRIKVLVPCIILHLEDISKKLLLFFLRKFEEIT